MSSHFDATAVFDGGDGPEPFALGQMLSAHGVRISSVTEGKASVVKSRSLSALSWPGARADHAADEVKPSSSGLEKTGYFVAASRTGSSLSGTAAASLDPLGPSGAI